MNKTDQPTTSTTEATANAQTALSDRALISAIALDRDQGAYAELYRRHEASLFRLARHLCRDTDSASDICQEAWMRIWTSAKAYRATAAVRNWLLSITANVALTHLNRRMTSRRRTAPSTALKSIVVPEAPCRLVQKETVTALRVGFQKLPQTSRQLLEMYFRKGMSQNEIGRKLRMPQRTISLRTQKAIQMLRESVLQQVRA